MALLTEEDVRRMSNQGTRGPVVVNRDQMLTPGARDYLREHRVEVVYPQGEAAGEGAPSAPAKYRTLFGAALNEKPEHMTQLFGNKLVCKDHPRILFRGKLDALQADVVLAQAMIQAAGGSATLLNDLGDILKDLREMMKCEVLDEEMKVDAVIGLTHEELRAQSHNPMKYYNIKQMVLPDYTMGTEYAMLNKLRTSIRETEVAACQAFHDGKKYIRTDIIEELNRLSSALHIMMCRHLAGWYSEDGGNE